MITSDTAYQSFLAAYPAYKNTCCLDELRQKDYGRLDTQDHIYLDYTGGGLYAESQLRSHMDLLNNHVFGNPHSHNPTSSAMTVLVEQTRSAVLSFFNASPDEYSVIFTANASGGLKLVGESYPFNSDGHFLISFDNHNSVNGIREFARLKGAKTSYIPLALPEMRVDEEQLSSSLQAIQPDSHNLFAFPAQSNFSGVQHPLEWIPLAQDQGWDVLLDAAAFVPTNPLDLSQWHPDFVPISFYKMFGHPTGVGCLLVRQRALEKLARPWFAGGTTTLVSVQSDVHDLRPGAEAFEDGTLNYLNLPAVEIGLRHLESIGMHTIHERVHCLTGWLLTQLSALHHSNGKPLIRLYGPVSTEHRGGTITVNFYDQSGEVINHQVIEQKANEQMISLRTGTFCNPGGGEMALSLDKTEMIICGQSPILTMDDVRLAIDSKSLGAVRISIGLVSNFQDINRLIAFVQTFLDC